MPLSTSGSLLLSSINSEFFPNDNPVNTYNWYNKMTYGTVHGYSPTVTGSDPTVQIQMSNSTGGVGSYIYQSNTPIQNANQFVFTWQMFINNTGSGDFINLYFGSNTACTTYGGVTSTNGMTFNFQLYPGGTGNTTGVYLYQNTTTIPSAGVYTNYVAKSTNTTWATNAWVNCMVVYQKGSQNTWNLYINGVNVISYNDPNNTGWLTQVGNYWGFQFYNGGATFTSYLRQLNLSTNLPFAVVTPYNWYTNMIPINYAHTYTPVSSGSDPNVQLQLSNGTSANNLQEAYVYNNFPVQNYSAFTLTFQFYLTSGFTANGFYASFGHQSNVLNNFAAGLGNRYLIYFNTWAANPIGGTGIYLINNSQNAYTASNYVASAAITWTTNAWNTVTINYSRNAGGTWQVSYNGVNYISYSDTSNQRWVTELAGNYWTIGSSSNTQTFYIRQVNMVVNPSSGGNSQKLVTPLNWYNKMTVSNFNGTYTAVSNGSDPNVSYQLSNAAQLEVGNSFYMQQRVQDYSSFTLQYDFKFIAGTGGNPWDGVYSYFGTTNNAAYNSSNNGFNIFNVLNTDVTGSQGSYLNTGSNSWFGGTFGNISTPLVANSWYTTTINYTKGTTGTWKVDVNGNTILNLSDPYNSSWVSTSSGNYWGIGGNSGGGATGSYFIKKVQLSYIPTKVNFSSFSGIAPGVSNTSGSTGISYSQLRGKTGTSSGLNSTNVLATDQGAYNSNTTYISSFTTDTSARMIQLYGQTNNLNNVANCRHLLQQTYTNVGNAVINATMTMSCQDFCKVYQNKVLIYPNFQVDAQMFTFQVILDIGVNLFEFVCWKNITGLGGFIYTLINNSGGAVLMRSDNNSSSALTNTSKITVISTPAQLGPLDYIPSTYICSGAYSLTKLKASVTLAVCNIRRSSDNATTDIYADWQGNLAILGGTSLANWLNGATGYIVTWYDQSGNGNNATTSSNAMQPVLTWNTTQGAWTVDTQNSSSQYLNIPSNTVPVGTQNQPYTFIIKHGSINNTGSGGFIGSGNGSTLTSNNIKCAITNSNAYVNYWFNGSEDLFFGSTGQLVSGNTLAVTYNGYNKRYAYINNNLTVTWTQVNNYTNASGQQYLFKTAVNEYLNGQMYFCYIFKNNLGSYNGTGASLNDIQDTSTLTTLSNTLAYTLPLPNPCLNQVPVLDAISTTSKSACRGAYALVRLSMSYTGATVNLRRGLDNATSDFYADIQGNLNTVINNTGTTLTNWLQGTIGYVAIWYDQSGNGNNATQATNGLQPVISPFSRYQYDDVNWLVDSQSSGTQRMLIPSGTVPTGTTNAPYSFVFRHQAWNTTTGGVLGAGIGATNQANSIRAGSDGSVGYYNYWYGNDFSLGSNAQRVAGNQVAITYNGSTQTGYINTTQITSVTHTGGTTASGQQYLFSDTVGNYMNGQIYYFYIFGIAVPDIDRLKLMTI